MIARLVSSLSESSRAEDGASLVARLVELLSELVPESGVAGDGIASPPRLLEEVRARRPDGEAPSLELPLTPLLDTTLLTNSRGEPAVGHELRAEIHSSDSIDVVMAFVRWSGIRPLLDALRRHCRDGRALRVVTTTYTNSTELRALDELAALGAEIKVSYDTRPLVCTRRRGCSIARAATRPPTSDRRT